MKITQEQQDYCLEIITRYNRDIAFISHFIPVSDRYDFLILNAFYAELNHVLDVIREPMMGHVRLQWWWDGIEAIINDTLSASNFASHPLGGLLKDYVTKENAFVFQRLIQTIETRVDNPQMVNFDDFYKLCLNGLGLIFKTLKGDAWQAIGANFEAISLLKNTQSFARKNRIIMPQSYFKEFGEADNDGVVELKPGGENFILATKEFHDDLMAKTVDIVKARDVLKLFERLTNIYGQQIEKCHYDLFDPRLNSRPFLTELKMTARALFRCY